MDAARVFFFLRRRLAIGYRTLNVVAAAADFPLAVAFPSA
jgi:hypothetical protein